MIESFYELSEDIDRYFEASAVLEVLDKLNFSSDAERAKVFVLALKTLKNICFTKVKTTYSLNKFFIELFKIFGFPIYTDKCTCCGNKVFDKLYINYQVGELVCLSCKNYGYEEINKPTYLALRLLNDMEFDKIASIKLANGSELSLLKVLVKNFEQRFDSRLKLMGILS